MHMRILQRQLQLTISQHAMMQDSKGITHSNEMMNVDHLMRKQPTMPSMMPIGRDPAEGLRWKGGGVARSPTAVAKAPSGVPPPCSRVGLRRPGY